MIERLFYILTSPSMLYSKIEHRNIRN